MGPCAKAYIDQSATVCVSDLGKYVSGWMTGMCVTGECVSECEWRQVDR